MCEKEDVDNLQLNESEENAIGELRKRLKNYVTKEKYEDTYVFYRFLKAEDFDIDSAEKNFKEALEKRKQLQVDSILTNYDPPEVLTKYLGNSRFGFAKDGSVVHYFAIGKMDNKGMQLSVKTLDLERFFFRLLEEDEQLLVKKRKSKNGSYPGYIYIYDTEGLSFADATNKRAIEHFLRILKIYERYYPEHLKRVYLINVFSYFAITFSIMKNMVSTKTLSKLFVLDDHKKELLKVIDSDQLPAFLGGSRTDPDGNPLCKTIVHQGGKVEEKYYIHKSRISLSSTSGIQKLVLSRASFSEIELDIKAAGSLIEWEFETKTKDIGFGVFFKEIIDGEERITELVPLLRLDTEQFCEVGLYKCERAGTYIVLFDNSYSWIRSKEIYYRTNVISPEKVEERLRSQ